METRLFPHIEIIKNIRQGIQIPPKDEGPSRVPWKLQNIQIREGKNNFPYPYLHVKLEFRGEKHMNASERAGERTGRPPGPGKDNED